MVPSLLSRLVVISAADDADAALELEDAVEDVLLDAEAALLDDWDAALLELLLPPLLLLLLLLPQPAMSNASASGATAMSRICRKSPPEFERGHPLRPRHPTIPSRPPTRWKLAHLTSPPPQRGRAARGLDGRWPESSRWPLCAAVRRRRPRAVP